VHESAIPICPWDQASLTPTSTLAFQTEEQSLNHEPQPTGCDAPHRPGPQPRDPTPENAAFFPVVITWLHLHDEAPVEALLQAKADLSHIREATMALTLPGDPRPHDHNLTPLPGGRMQPPWNCHPPAPPRRLSSAPTLPSHLISST